MRGHVLIIDDEEKLRNLMAKIISLEGFEVHQAPDCRSGLKFLDTKTVDVVICDVKLPDGSGIELAAKIKALHPIAEVILLTAYGNIPDSVQAIKNGAFDYLTKGDDNNRIIPLLYRAMDKVSLTRRVRELEAQIDNRYTFSNIIGNSPAIRQALESARRVSASDATVLLTGETGTGKEVFAQAIHYAGNRRDKKFIAVNCASFSKELLENELFGHKAGAFTGAVKESKGIFEEANGGTVFLDELGEMSPDLQAKLLRVLETGEFLKIGDSKTTRVNVRIIVATNRDLLKEVELGHFREDLYYRVSVFEITLPSLRDRVEDVEALSLFFLQQFSSKMRKSISGMSGEFLAALKTHSWKGNIRELRNIIERSVILTDGGELTVASLPAEFRQEPAPTRQGAETLFDLARIEEQHIRKVLLHTRGNKTEAARLLNIALSTLYRKIEEYRIG
jgi:DNA-binding NtrC family response regulator